MKSRNILQTVLLTLIAAGVFLVLSSSRPSTEKGSCKELMEQCVKKNGGDGADKMIWENLSQQFFSSI